MVKRIQIGRPVGKRPFSAHVWFDAADLDALESISQALWLAGAYRQPPSKAECIRAAIQRTARALTKQFNLTQVYNGESEG